VFWPLVCSGPSLSAKNQTDDAWDRPLHLVEREFPELWQQAPSPESAGADGPGIVQVLHLRDPLVRPQLDDLAQRFKGREVLQYLLIDDVAGDAMSAHE
jgi:hypothetical protein